MRYPYKVRDVEPGAVDPVHRMNEQALPHVNSVTPEYFHAQVAAHGGYFRAVYLDREPVAFLLAMNEAADYDSLNFLWFRDRYPQFVYIDRVVVTAVHRRAGLGAMLYDDLMRWATPRTSRLACEVNVRPSNEPSMRFHRKQGFMPVGTQDTDGGRKTVSLMIKELGA